MSRYNFINPGAAAVNELTQALAEREAQRRQALLDQLALRRESRTDDVQRATLASIDEQRDIAGQQRKQEMAAKLAGMIRPTQDLDPATSQTLKEGGLGILIRPAGPAQDGETDATVNTTDVFRGTPTQLQQQEEMQRKQEALQAMDPNSEAYRAIQHEMLTGNNAPAFLGDDTSRRNVIVGSFEDFIRQKFGERPTSEQITQARQKYAEAGRDQATGVGERPYFMPQTLYDKQGRPIGVGSFDSRTGRLVEVTPPVEGATIKPPTATLGNQSILNEAALDSLDNLKTLYDTGAKDLIGPVEGRARNTGQQIPGVPVNPLFANFQAATAAFKNETIRAITGAAMAAAEQARILSQLPLETDKPEVWLAKYKQTRLNLARIENRMRKDRDTPDTSSATPAPSTTAPTIEDLRKRFNY